MVRKLINIIAILCLVVLPQFVTAQVAKQDDVVPVGIITLLSEMKDDTEADKKADKALTDVEDDEDLLGNQLDERAWAFATIVYRILTAILLIIIFLMAFYSVRHYIFTLNRVFGNQRYPYLDIDSANWPSVTVLVAAHNEEAVIAGALNALLNVDYPRDKIRIMPMNDRSTDRTREIIDALVERYPGAITPFHRSSGKPGKAAALKDAMKLLDSEIIVVFDADYLPSRGLVKQLVSPFFDPEVGATMGRVVPQNVGSNLLTRILDLERSGGYQVDQQARMNLHLVPQYGGTVGGIRVNALESIGGWRDDVLAEDTDLTYRLLLNDWKVVYQNRSECYEEVPEVWSVRMKQIMRWAKGHNQAMISHTIGLFKKQGLTFFEKLDGLALLGVYVMAPLLILAWVISIILFYFTPSFIVTTFIVFFSFVLFSALGNFAAFFQMAAATYLDGSRHRIRLLPFVLFGFVISVVAISQATLSQLLDIFLKREMKWDKTQRYRNTNH